MKFGKMHNGACKVYDDKNSCIAFSIYNPTFASDVIIMNNYRYIKLKIDNSSLNHITMIESMCKEHCSAYTSAIHNDTILVKLPYRYNRYMIDYQNCTSELFGRDKTAASVTIELCGIVTLSSGMITSSYKLLSLTN